jgi:hypothetical protein
MAMELKNKKYIDNVNIAVFGATGVGKSTFIRHLIGEPVVIGNGLEACKIMDARSWHVLELTNARHTQRPGL